MQENISKAENALNVAETAGDDALTMQEQHALTVFGTGQAIVAIAKGVSVLGAVAFLAYRSFRSFRSSDPSSPVSAKLEEMIEKGLGL